MFTIFLNPDEPPGRTFVAPSELTEGMVFSVGRDKGCEIVIDADHVSSSHGEFVYHRDRLYFRDLRSTNGTVLRRGGSLITLGEANAWAMQLRHQDTLLLGNPDEAVHIRVELNDMRTQRFKLDSEQSVLAVTHLHSVHALEGELALDPRRATRLYSASKLLKSSLDLHEVCMSSCAAIFELLSLATNITVLLDQNPMSPSEDKESDHKKFVPFLSLNRDGEQGVGERPSKQVVALVFEQRAGVVVCDTEDINPSQSIVRAQIRSVMAAPLAVADQIVGLIQVDNRAASGGFTQDDLEALLVLTQQMALSIQNARLFQRVSVAERRLQGENKFLRDREGRSYQNIIGESEPMRRVLELVERVVDTNATVLVTGETGTGKEVIARLIHERSQRKDKLFVAQNCSALPEALLESELFGHKKGAFTGADSDKKGLFELAHGGTMFLDEIGETSAALQAKLLRVLQESEVRPVGAPRPRRVDARVIAATNRDLMAEVRAGRFREDLYYRLNVFPIHLPPLRERKVDISRLAEFYLRKFSKEFSRPAVNFSPEALGLLQSYRWPGNIRELQNEIQRLVIHGVPGDLILPEHLAPRLNRAASLLKKVNPPKGGLKQMMEEVERWVLIETLREHDNNKTHAAAALSITREGLHKKLSRHGL